MIFALQFLVIIVVSIEKKGLSQDIFAHENNLQRTFYGDVERGKRNLTLANIFKIADALGIDPKLLFDEMQEGVKTEKN